MFRQGEFPEVWTKSLYTYDFVRIEYFKRNVINQSI